MAKSYLMQERFQENHNDLMNQALVLYKDDIAKITWRYFRFFSGNPAINIDDLQQEAWIKVMEIAARSPDKFHIKPYVRKAIRKDRKSTRLNSSHSSSS